MKNLKLGYKLALGFGLVLLFTTLLAIAAYVGLRLVTGAAENAATANDVARLMLEVRRQEKNFQLRGLTVLNGDSQNAVEILDEHIAALESNLVDLRARLTDPTAQALTDEVGTHLASYKVTFAQYVEMEAIKSASEGALVAAANEAISVTDSMRNELRNKFQVDLRSNVDSYTLRDHWQKFTDVDLLAEGILEIRQSEQDFKQTKNPDHITVIDDKIAEMATLVDSLKMRFTDAASDNQLDEILTRMQTYQANLHAYVDAMDNQAAQERVLIDDARVVQEVATDLRANEDTKMAATEQMTLRLIMIGGLLAALVGIGAAWLISRIITRPITHLQAVSEQIAVGDLDVVVEVTSHDEVGAMTAAFQRMVGYLRQMAQAADKIADGNLAVTVIPESESDQLGIAFQKMTHKLRLTVADLQRSAEAVAAASQQLTSAADQSGQAAQQIALTMDQVAQGTAQQAAGMERTRQIMVDQGHAIGGIADGAQKQAESVEKAQRVLEERLTRSIQQVEETAAQSEQATNEAKRVARGGADSVRQTIQGMQTIARATEQISHRIVEMSERSRRVGNIVQTIDEIAERTNLLALNAAIEAARAGEHGRGFAVVADEVRKLAEQSARSAGEITELIRTLQQAANQATSVMDSSSKEVSDGVALAAGAEQGLEQIQHVVTDMGVQMEYLSRAVVEMNGSRNELLSTMQQVATVVAENTASTEALAANSDQVLLTIKEVASVSEENSAAAEEVSAGAEEVSAQVEETVAAANSLSRMAVELSQIAARFTLEEKQPLQHHEPTTHAPITKHEMHEVSTAEAVQPEAVFDGIKEYA